MNKENITRMILAAADNSAGSGFNNLQQAIENYLKSDILPLGITVIIISLVCVGFGMMSGRKAREWAKEHILWVVIGSAVLYNAFAIAQKYVSAMYF